MTNSTVRPVQAPGGFGIDQSLFSGAGVGGSNGALPTTPMDITGPGVPFGGGGTDGGAKDMGAGVMSGGATDGHAHPAAGGAGAFTKPD